MPSHVTHPEPGARGKTPGVTIKPGPGRTRGITTKGDGKSSFNREGGFRGKTALDHSSGKTTDATKTSDGKTSFRRA